jgi:hypothetical protein
MRPFSIETKARSLAARRLLIRFVQSQAELAYRQPLDLAVELGKELIACVRANEEQSERCRMLRNVNSHLAALGGGQELLTLARRSCESALSLAMAEMTFAIVHSANNWTSAYLQSTEAIGQTGALMVPLASATHKACSGIVESATKAGWGTLNAPTFASSLAKEATLASDMMKSIQRTRVCAQVAVTQALEEISQLLVSARPAIDANDWLRFGAPELIRIQTRLDAAAAVLKAAEVLEEPLAVLRRMLSQRGHLESTRLLRELV